MTSGRDRFGAFIRRKREEKEIGLREMAKLIGVSATYLSKVERDEFTPPTEDKVRRLAELLDCDADELIMMAGRMPSDLTEIIRERPRELAALLRTAKSLTKEELERFHRNAQKIRDTD